MERKIGEIFEYNDEWYLCVKSDNTCNGCVGKFQPYSFCNDFKKCVGKIFKKLEKLGEPFERNGYMYQEYKVHTFPLLMNGGAKIPTSNGFGVIIKQNKEDMEEKKQCGDNKFRTIARAKEHLFQATNIAEDKKELEVLDSFLLRCWQMGWLERYEEETKELDLKPFSIEAAKAGKPVCTRDCRKARIICFDAKFPQTGNIVTLVEKETGEEVILYHYDDGHCSIGRDYDLMMLPEKKSGWVNVYMEETNNNERLAEQVIYKTRKDALDNACPRGYKATVKIEWEE